MSRFNNNSKVRYLKIGEKVVATLRDGRLLDIRKHSNHFIYCKDDEGTLQRAVCIANETLRQARRANVIQLTDIEQGIKYTISRADFDRHSFNFEGARVANLESQRACFLKWFASNEPERPNYPRHIEAEPLPEPCEKQMSLLGWFR